MALKLLLMRRQQTCFGIDSAMSFWQDMQGAAIGPKPGDRRNVTEARFGQKLSGEPGFDSNVVEFVAVKASTNHKDQQPAAGGW